MNIICTYCRKKIRGIIYKKFEIKNERYCEICVNVIYPDRIYVNFISDKENLKREIKMSKEITEKDKGSHIGYEMINFFDKRYVEQEILKSYMNILEDEIKKIHEKINKLENSWWNRIFR